MIANHHELISQLCLRAPKTVWRIPNAYMRPSGRIRVPEEVIVHYTKLYADADGESHFADVELTFNLMDFAPSAPLVHVASFSQAKQVVFLRAPAGFDAGQHTTPARQLVFVLAGVHAITASDGEVRHFAPGSVLLAEDTTGKGHMTHIMEDGDTLVAYIQLPG
jgi:hypothetical protein